MKKVVFYMMLLVMSIGYAYAQGKADIKFEQTTHNFGTFSENSPVVSYTFKFTNVGDAPLVIHQAVASCGCTVPEYSQEPIAPGNTPDTSRNPLPCAPMPKRKSCDYLSKGT